MDKEKELFDKIGSKLSKKYRLVKIGKMMSSPGFSYKKKILCFFYKNEITLRLGQDFVPEIHGIKEWKYLNPFKSKSAMKNWFQLPYSEKKNWEKFAIRAMESLQKEFNSKEKI